MPASSSSPKRWCKFFSSDGTPVAVSTQSFLEIGEGLLPSAHLICSLGEEDHFEEERYWRAATLAFEAWAHRADGEPLEDLFRRVESALRKPRERSSRAEFLMEWEAGLAASKAARSLHAWLACHAERWEVGKVFVSPAGYAAVADEIYMRDGRRVLSDLRLCLGEEHRRPLAIRSAAKLAAAALADFDAQTRASRQPKPVDDLLTLVIHLDTGECFPVFWKEKVPERAWIGVLSSPFVHRFLAFLCAYRGPEALAETNAAPALERVRRRRRDYLGHFPNSPQRYRFYTPDGKERALLSPWEAWERCMVPSVTSVLLPWRLGHAQKLQAFLVREVIEETLRYLWDHPTACRQEAVSAGVRLARSAGQTRQEEGTLAHRVLEEFHKVGALVAPPHLERALQAYRKWFLQSKAAVVEAERSVVSREGYAGTLDAVLVLYHQGRRKTAIVDMKFVDFPRVSGEPTEEDFQRKLYEERGLQLAAYRLAYGQGESLLSVLVERRSGKLYTCFWEETEGGIGRLERLWAWRLAGWKELYYDSALAYDKWHAPRLRA